MEMNGGFLVTKIKQLGDRIFEKILSEKNIDAFNGAHYYYPLPYGCCFSLHLLPNRIEISLFRTLQPMGGQYHTLGSSPISKRSSPPFIRSA